MPMSKTNKRIAIGALAVTAYANYVSFITKIPLSYSLVSDCAEQGIDVDLKRTAMITASMTSIRIIKEDEIAAANKSSDPAILETTASQPFCKLLTDKSDLTPGRFASTIYNGSSIKQLFQSAGIFLLTAPGGYLGAMYGGTMQKRIALIMEPTRADNTVAPSTPNPNL